MPQVKVAFCMPSYIHPHPEVMVNFTLAFHETLAAGAAASIKANMMAGIDIARNDLVEKALVDNPTHIFFVDSDVVIPSGTVVRLLSHKVQCVGGLYHYKVPPFNPVVFKLNPFEHLTDLKNRGAPHQVDGMGLGCLLITASVFEMLAKSDASLPFFKMAPDKGEDVYFFERLKALRVKAYLDPSIRCGHIRSQTITTLDWEQYHL